ncbi:MAG: T9SS type A sorting domain-containing protein [Chitinophagaceae bacterium]|nr:MAG: T9SS type A sorting domain-containing protein [Chitinophagaceae bacterium]
MKRLLLIVFIALFSTVSEAQTRPLPLTGAQSSIVRFYPNPATSVINFDFQKDYEKGYSIQIFNAILGRKMYEQANMPERMNVNLSEFSRGIYIYQLRDKSGRMVESGKFQVAK